MYIISISISRTALRLGTNVIEAIGVSKAYGDKVTYEEFKFKLPQAGMCRYNGLYILAGKNTIFTNDNGEEKPDKGWNL